MGSGAAETVGCDVVGGEPLVRGDDATPPVVPGPQAATNRAASAQAAANLTSSRTRPPAAGYALAERLPMALGPSGPATITVSVRPMNNPCSTTPVVTLIAVASLAGSAMPPSKVRSRIRLPLSVT